MPDMGYTLEPIAIVGSGCRFAGGVDTPSALWDLLKAPRDLSKEVPSNRFNIKAFFHEDGEHHGTTNCPKAYWLEQNHKQFDAGFFSVTPKEAEAVDPQQRMLLEVVYEALESAGYSLRQYAEKKVGVYAGAMTADYDTLSARDDLTTSQYNATGTARSIISNRISYFFDFNGPSMTIDTACSSSLVALHQAVLGLRADQTEMACVAGVNLMLTPEAFVAESSLHMLSPNGRCRMWDANADGYARGEGVVALLIKKLSRAIADGDRIEAVIRETGVNSDGRSRGITMPNAVAQARLLRDTYRRAGLDANAERDRPQYFEAHGTGTQAGDPNEARAIADAFFGNAECSGKTSGQKLLVGSVKTVIGHTEGASGLAGLIKVIHSIRHGFIPPNLHLDRLNPSVAPHCGHLQVPTRLTPWPAVPSGEPRRASVNSFGFGGTNAHAIVEQYVPDVQKLGHTVPMASVGRTSSTWAWKMPSPSERQELPLLGLPLMLSAASPKSLVAVAKSFRDFLVGSSQTSPDEIAWHLYARRTAFSHRLCLPAGSSTAAMMQSLDLLLGQPNPSKGTRCSPEDEPPAILGIFTGQGAQWATMGKRLLEESKTFAARIESLDGYLQTCPHPPPWTLAGEMRKREDTSQVNCASICQPLCTAIQIALVDLLTRLGIKFKAVVGHSSGEVAAAYVAGRLTARDAIILAYYRGGVARQAGCGQRDEPGRMLAAALSYPEALDLCARDEYKDRLFVAASNAPSMVTLSGAKAAIEAVEEELAGQGTFARMLKIEVAYHSPYMREPAVQYMEVLKSVHIRPKPHDKLTQTAWVSSVFGDSRAIDTSQLGGAYWRDNMVQAVLFSEAVTTTVKTFGPFDCAIELGPHPTLAGPTTKTIQQALGQPIPYFGALERQKDDVHVFLQLLGILWTRFGACSQLIRGFVEDASPHRTALLTARVDGLPAYPWDHSQEYFRESRLARQCHQRKDAPHELLGRRTLDDNAHELRWRNILQLERLAWADGHRFQGQALLPASAYCVMAYNAATVALAGRTASVIELVDVDFAAGIVLERDTPGMEVLTSLTMRPVSERTRSDVLEAFFSVSSVPADGSTDMKRNFTVGILRMVLHEPSVDALPPREPDRVNKADMMPVDASFFYKAMAETGLQYSGAFAGLQTMARRFETASGTVRKRHREDGTSLKVSPAMLDSCFQAAFLTYSAPGDGSLWTSFLPRNMKRISFNTAMCERKSPDNDSLMAVEAQLTRVKSPADDSPTTFTVDMGVFDNASGQAAIQVEGITVASFATTKAEDDCEPILRNVLDVDPEYEIVTQTKSELAVADCRVLLEGVERVFSFCKLPPPPPLPPPQLALSHPQLLPPSPPLSPMLLVSDDWRTCTAAPRPDDPEDQAQRVKLPCITSPWPSETAETLDAFIQASPFAACLDQVRILAETLPHMLSSILPVMVEEAQTLVGLGKHMGRIAAQIAHRYPRMHVLDLTDPDLGLTAHILAGLSDAFLSYQACAVDNARLLGRLSKNQAAKVVVGETTLSGQDPRAAYHDLVIVSTSCLKGHNDARAAWKQLRAKMRPGGFIMVLDQSGTLVKDSVRICCAESCTLKTPGGPTLTQTLTPPSQWTAEFSESCGFAPSAARNAHQRFEFGLVLSVRQAFSEPKDMLLRPLEHAGGSRLLTSRVLVSGRDEILMGSLGEHLQGKCGSLSLSSGLGDETLTQLESLTAVILLDDPRQPLIAGMTERSMQNLKALLRPEMLVLWVTRKARTENPDHAAAFGFARTILAEVPGIAFQMLDLGGEPKRSDGLVVAQAFASLAMYANMDRTTTQLQETLWVQEPEIHVDECGRRLVPRVRPWREANARANVLRRRVTEEVNTLEKAVVLSIGAPAHDGVSRYEVSLPETETAGSRDELHPDALQVHYSSVAPVKFGQGLSGHVCLGTHHTTGRVHLAMSETAASWIRGPFTCCTQLKASPAYPAPAQLMALVIRYLAAHHMAAEALVHDRPVVVVEPDAVMHHCVKEIFSERHIVLKVVTADRKHLAAHADLRYLHAQSSTPSLAAAFPLGGAHVYDFGGENNELSERLSKVCPADCEYRTTYDLTPGACRAERRTVTNSVEAEQVYARATWDAAVLRALAACHDRKLLDLLASTVPPAISLPSLLAIRPTQKSAFGLLSWQAERNVPRSVTPVGAGGGPNKMLLRPDKTYLLAGLTRDLGQSLCRFFASQGARHFVLSSRNPPSARPAWAAELSRTHGCRIRIEPLDITSLDAVLALKHGLTSSAETPNKPFPPIGGVINAAMILDDSVFNTMTLAQLHRVLAPKTIGSRNLDVAFSDPNEVDFFIMTSSFAAIGGHAGQGNYAAANMYMNGLAEARRRRGLHAVALNLGVIYGLGLLAREREDLYTGLERDGYPPVSERDVHRIVMEGIVVGKPGAAEAGANGDGRVVERDLTTGLRRFEWKTRSLRWHMDPRFGHFSTPGHHSGNAKKDAAETDYTLSKLGVAELTLKRALETLTTAAADTDVDNETCLSALETAFIRYLENLLQLSEENEALITRDTNMAELGIDSLVALEIRSWFWKVVGTDVAVMKILGPGAGVGRLCNEAFASILVRAGMGLGKGM